MSKIKFLISLGNLIKTGGVKTVKQAMDFAEQQFGKLDKSFTDDIINVFKKEGKTKKGDVVPIKKEEGIKSTQEYKDIVEELRNSEIGNTYSGEDLEKAALDILKVRNKLKGTLEAEQTLKKRTDDIMKEDIGEEKGILTLTDELKQKACLMISLML